MLHAWLSPLAGPPPGRSDLVSGPERPVRPRVRDAVKGLVATADSVLLVRERHADGSPFWTLPGGGVRAGERPAAAVEREFGEELRCRCVVGDPVDAFTYAHTSSRALSLYTVYECRLASEPTPVENQGVFDCRWVSPDSLPPRTLPQVRAVVERTDLSR